MTEEEALHRLKEMQRRDQIKTDFCKDNNIELIRIPYWEFDCIEDILEDYFQLYKII